MADASQSSKRVWTTLITNTKYLSGLLTLEYSLKKNGSKYPLVALFTESFPAEGHEALKRRGIAAKEIPYLLPSVPKAYANDPRFYDCWSKLAPYSLTEYDRVVQLDSDMLVLQNMDELMELELDPPEMNGDGNRVYAASQHVHVTRSRNHITRSTGYRRIARSPHSTAHQIWRKPRALHQRLAFRVQMVVCRWSIPVWAPTIRSLDTLKNGDLTDSYDFADQSLLGERFYGRWVAIPYIYNALKTLRMKGVHDAIWRDESVKNIHYILSPKPWDETLETATNETHKWWLELNQERLEAEGAQGINDGF